MGGGGGLEEQGRMLTEDRGRLTLVSIRCVPEDNLCLQLWLLLWFIVGRCLYCRLNTVDGKIMYGEYERIWKKVVVAYLR